MKNLITILFLLIGMSVFAQGSGDMHPTTLVKPITKPVGIAIDPLNQADIKALNEAMKPYEDIVKEYNRLAGLKNNIYQTLIKAKGINIKDLAKEPQITTDTINLVVNVVGVTTKK